MDRRKQACASVVPLAALIFATSACAEQCVRIVGTESSLPHISFDPANQPTGDDSFGQYAVFNRLIQLDPATMQPVPVLASSWTPSIDGKVWTFKLQEGVKFSDGRAFGANDVVYTLRRLIDPATGSAAASSLSFLKSEGIEAVDDHTVEITTVDPVADLPTRLAIKQALIVPEGATSEQLNSHPIGTGPFILTEFSPSETRRVLQRNPHYWKPGLPKASCLELSVNSEEVSRTASIQSGAADILVNVGPANAEVLKKDSNVQVLTAAPGAFFTLSMQTDVKPFNDVRVRQAIKAVIDRKVMADTVMLGYASPGNDSPTPPTWPDAYQSTFIQRDVDKAKKLLAEAGYPDGIDIELNTAEAMANMLTFAQAFQQMAADADIRVQIVNNPADTYWDTIWMKRPFFTSAWDPRPTGEALAYEFSSSAAYNEGNWKNPEFDKLLDQARSELDSEKRNALLKDAQKLLAEDGGIVIPFFSSVMDVIRVQCHGFKPHMQAFNQDYETVSCDDRK